MVKILIVNNNLNTCRLLDNLFKKHGYSSSFITSGKKALEYLKSHVQEIVVCDFSLPDIKGKEILARIKDINPVIPVIFTTDDSNIRTAVEVIKMGAFDYITKPLLPEELLLLIEKAEIHINGYVENDYQKSLLNADTQRSNIKDFIIGKSSKALTLQKQIALVAPTNYSVIISGESGTGKESVAYRIHIASPRKNKPFIAIDCGTLTKELACSELFGHEKGAFTGALHSKIGQFELASGGTIFLDEITNLPYDIQMCLLRVTQERKIRRVGSAKEINIDVRILVASNEKIQEASNHGKFREDLFYRFNEFSIDVPPLRKREEDIMIFADFFLQHVNKECGKKIAGFAPEVEKIFLAYNWPGNLREMDNVIKRAALLCHGNIITLDALPQEMVFHTKLGFAHPKTSNDTQTIAELKSVALTAEYEKIMEVLNKVNFNKSEAALLLNIDRKTLYNKMRAFNFLQPTG